ncbi:hypothetical protein [Euzebya tangerina]|uniref:hypothetical protein n=1 Tax=Euzebya tangerina TaxID=591198 RepID=UPI000E322147|nr:hypothetical protein [Euzebya tangerina]
MVKRTRAAGSDAFHRVVEGALAEERANALGRAGRRLDEAIDTHRLLVEVGVATESQIAVALDAVAHEAWKLVVQRECAGFRSNAVDWVRTNYDIPAAALRRL